MASRGYRIGPTVVTVASIGVTLVDSGDGQSVVFLERELDELITVLLEGREALREAAREAAAELVRARKVGA